MCGTANFGCRCRSWVIRVIRATADRVRFTPVSDQIAAPQQLKLSRPSARWPNALVDGSDGRNQRTTIMVREKLFLIETDAQVAGFDLVLSLRYS